MYQDARDLNAGQKKPRLLIFRIIIVTLAITLATLPVLTSLHIAHSYSSASSQKVVVVIQLYEEIDQGSASMITRGISQANVENAQAVVIDMNTPGGILSDMLTMIGAINSSKVPVYTFVGNASSAASAGSYVAMATDRIYMGTGSVIGPSTPYIIGGTSLEQAHVANYTLALMQSLALEHSRNVTAASQMAQNNVAYPGSLAIQYHLVDGYSGSLAQTLSLINASSASVQTVSENPSEQILSLLSNSTVDGILLLIGIIAIVLDFLHPTILLSIAGAVLIVLALIGAEAIQGPSNYPGIYLPIILFILAASLIVLELKTGHGFMLLAGGIVGAFATLLLAYQVPYSPSPIGNLQYLEVGLLILAVAILALYARYVGSAIRKKPVTGAESLIGASAIVYSEELSPDGEVSVDGVIWKARLLSAGLPIKKGEIVIVKRVEGLTLMVDRKA